jgi:hypothetical protein
MLKTIWIGSHAMRNHRQVANEADCFLIHNYGDVLALIFFHH